MGKTRIYQYNWLANNNVWIPRLDKERFQILENSLLGIFNYVGQGILDGWEVLSYNDATEKDVVEFASKGLSYVTSAEIAGLSSSTKNALEHLDYEMIIKITEGDGIVGTWAAFTVAPSAESSRAFYYAISKEKTDTTWYVYIVPTLALPEPLKHKASILVTTDGSYDDTNTAVYLATVSVNYDSLTNSHNIQEITTGTNRRRNIYRLQGIGTDSIKDEFLRHKHDGADAAKIKLDTSKLLASEDKTPVVDPSPQYLTDSISLQQSLKVGPVIESVQELGFNGSLEDGNWYYAITFNRRDDTGLQESLPGATVSVAVTKDNGKTRVTWQPVIGAESYNVYRTASVNGDPTDLYRLVTENPDYFYVDDGSDVLEGSIVAPSEVSGDITTIQTEFENVDIVTPGDDIMVEQEDGTLTKLIYKIPGLGETSPAFGARRTKINVTDERSYYQAEVIKNGVSLSPDDYRIILEDATLGKAIVELKNNVKETDTVEVLLRINPTETEVSGQLRSNRIGSISAASFRYGDIDKRFLTTPNHYGLQRVREAAVLRPYVDMRTRDYYTYYVQDPNGQIQYDDEIWFHGKCINAHIDLGVPPTSPDEKLTDPLDRYLNDINLNDATSESEVISGSAGGFAKHIVSSRHGNYITENYQYFERISGLPEDSGIIVDAIDNLAMGRAGGENYYNETYVLLNTGKIFYSQDNLETWTELTYPESNFTATAFTVSTNIVESEIQGSLVPRYSKMFYIGGYTTGSNSQSGIWTAELSNGVAMTDIPWELDDIWVGNPGLVFCITELITKAVTPISSTLTRVSYDRTYFSGTSRGFFANQTEKTTYISGVETSLYPTKIIWLIDEHTHPDDKSSLSNEQRYGWLNNLLLYTSSKVYSTHSAEYVERNTQYGTAKSWHHPLSRKIQRPYEIADASDFSLSSLSFCNEATKYVFTGSEGSIWYGEERIKDATKRTDNMLFEFDVTSDHSSSILLFEIDIAGTVGAAALLFSMTVEGDAATDAVLAYDDTAYAEFFGWDPTYWKLVASSNLVGEPQSLDSIGSVRQYGYGPPFLESGSGRTGPFSQKTLEEEESDLYISFTYESSLSSTTLTFEDGTEITATNKTTLEGTGTGDFEIATKILWANIKGYKLNNYISDDSTIDPEIWLERTSPDINSFPSWQEPLDNPEGTNASSNSSDSSGSLAEIGATTVSLRAFGGVGTTLGFNNNRDEYIFPKTNSTILGSKNGFWIGENNDGTDFARTYYFWGNGIIPNIYKNDVLLLDSTYTTSQKQQSVTFGETQYSDDIFTIEKDFREYFLVNGAWKQSGADLVVYVDEDPTSRVWSYDSSRGLILFDKALGRNNNVKMTILKREAYITDIGTIPHEEIDQAYIIDEDTKSLLSQTLEADDNIIYIDAATFPSSTKFISINGERIPVEIRSKNDLTGKTTSFRITASRTSTTTHAINSIVYLVEVKSLLGIQDYLSQATSSGVTYNLHSLFISDLLRLSTTLRYKWDDITGQPLFIASMAGENATVEEGFVNSYFYTFNGDDSTFELDTLNSQTTFREGIDVSTTDIPVRSRQIFCIYDQTDFEDDDALVGTDRGIWKRRLDGDWFRVSSCDNCTRVFFIKSVRGQIWAGTDNGLWISEDSGDTWEQNDTYWQSLLNFSEGRLEWTGTRSEKGSEGSNIGETMPDDGRYFEAYCKEDGLVMVLYVNNADGTGYFWSDHLPSSDLVNVYFLSKHEVITVSSNAQTGITRPDGVHAGAENGLWGIANGASSVDTVYTDFISEADISQEDTRTFQGTIKIYDPNELANGNQVETYLTQNLNYYKFFANPIMPDGSVETGFGNIEWVYLTNDGVKISKDYPFISTGTNATWVAEPLKGEGYICYDYLVLDDPTADDTSLRWRKTKLFIGTNKGILYSLDGGYTWTPCNKPSGEVFAVYGFSYSNSTIYAFTNRGLFSSSDQGDTWSEDNTELSTSKKLIEGYDLAQSYVPSTTILNKISVRLNKKRNFKNFGNQEGFDNEENMAISLKIYDNFYSEVPSDTLIAASTTVLTVQDVNEDAWYTFEFPDNTILNTNHVHSIVLSVINDEEGLVSWAFSQDQDANDEFSSPSNLQMLRKDVDTGFWSPLYDGDYAFYFLSQYDAVQALIETTNSVTYQQDNANNIAKTTNNTLALDIRFILSFIIDGTGSMEWQDSDGLRRAKLLEFIDKFLARNRWSYVDIWSFDTKIRQSLSDGLTRDIEKIGSAINSVVSTGTDSEVWSGSIRGISNMYYDGISQYIEDAADIDFVIHYMDSMLRIDHEYLQEVDPNYDGDVQKLILDEFANIRQLVIDDFILTYARAAFVATDGFDFTDYGDEWRDLTGVMNSMKLDDAQAPLFMFGLGNNSHQTGMIAACQETGGAFFNVQNDSSQWDYAIDQILNGDHYIWQGTYSDRIDFGDEVEFVKSLYLPATIPDTSSVILEIRYTDDNTHWTSWTEYDANTTISINAFVNVIEYKITLRQGDTIAGDPESFVDYENDEYGLDGLTTSVYPSPLVSALEYITVTPTRTEYVFESIDSDPIFEYMLTSSAIIHDKARVSWYLTRGDSLNLATYHELSQNKKNVLLNRENAFEFVPSSETDFINMYNLAGGYVWGAFDAETAADLGGAATITWEATDQVTVYSNGIELDPDLTPYREIPSFGQIEFLNEPIDEESFVTINIFTPASTSTKNGEDTVRLNDNTYQALNGPWPYDSEVLVYRNDILVTDGFALVPEQGVVIFDDPLVDDDSYTEVVRLAIVHSGSFRLKAVVENYSSAAVDLQDVALMYSTIDSNINTDILRMTTEPEVANNIVKLTSFEKENTFYLSNDDELVGQYLMHLDSIPYAEYTYSISADIPEQGTEIKWYRKRKGDTTFSEVTEYAGLISKKISDTIAEYNELDPTASIWTEGDTWKVTVTPKTLLAAGTTITSNEIVIGLYNSITDEIDLASSYTPVVYDLQVMKNASSTGALNWTGGTELSLSDSTYEHYYRETKDHAGAVHQVKFRLAKDLDADEDTILAETIIRWYLNGNSEPTYYSDRYNDNDPVLPSNGNNGKWATPPLNALESWYCEIIPFDGSFYGLPLKSYRIEIDP